MPDLGKQRNSVPILADSENETQNLCESITIQEPENEDPAPEASMSENEDPAPEASMPEDLTQWWEDAKESGWLPWAVAAGFGVLWLRKGKNN
jgi:hypothetical protein